MATPTKRKRKLTQKTGRPDKIESLINRIRDAEEVRIYKNCDFFEQWNSDMPSIMAEMLAYAKGQSETMDASRYKACADIYAKWVSVGDLLSEAADKLEEKIAPKKEVETTQQGNIISFSTTAPKN